MRCAAGLLVWVLAGGALAAADGSTAVQAVEPSAAAGREAGGGVRISEDGFEQAVGVLRRYQATLNKRAAAVRRTHRARARPLRDLAAGPPQSAQRHIRRVVQAAARWLGFVDEGAAQRRAGAAQPKAVQQAVQTVRGLAGEGHEGARFVLAEMEMYGRYGAEADVAAAFAHYGQLAAASGNATAQYMLGLFYATGLGGVEQQNSLALLYTTLAAIQGHTAAEVTLAFRHLSGIGVPVSCEKALGYYQSVARKAIRYYLSGPVLGRHMPEYRVRLADERGGTYGVRTGPYSLHRPVDRQSFDEILDYHRENALDGDVKACMTLVDLYYNGHRYAPRSYGLALTYLRKIEELVFTRQGELRKGLTQPEINAAAQAAGMRGIMSLRGEGGPVDAAAARKWLGIGAKLGHGISLNALGVMHQEGIGMPRNMERAIELFKMAAERRHPGGQVNFALAVIGVMPEVAHEHLKKAAEGGHILAHFHLAELYSGMASSEIQCRMAAASYKFVAENGDWLHSPVPEAAAAYQRGDLDAAVVGYVSAAEMGYGVAQQNAALLLEAAARAALAAEAEAALGPANATQPQQPQQQQRQTWPLFGSQQAHMRQTLAYWTRAANQGMSDARVKQGDHYFYGWGVEPSAERAAAAYSIAAEADANGLAMWNLGWMYENGIGVQRDFYLAKRWYDKSIEVNEGGKLAAHVSLARLCIKYLWAWASGQDVGESPLFFAPRPVADEDGDMAWEDAADDGADGADGDGRGEQAAQIQPARRRPGDEYVPDDWEQDADGLGPDGGGGSGPDDGGGGGGGDDDESTDWSLAAVLLVLGAAWMFLPRR
ncbi:ERAD-associated protein [Coemansia javaensis]|uniref:ERAD-associated protein n=1 Tax=Coemansia javaensis TaxID=2761396 RepID=A0A9W8LJX1_9FUNG|nr:ERAD-associated protein [Coemansia javaensis]